MNTSLPVSCSSGSVVSFSCLQSFILLCVLKLVFIAVSCLFDFITSKISRYFDVIKCVQDLVTFIRCIVWWS
jgi:hypothetical protein